jgi:hypothetical protein
VIGERKKVAGTHNPHSGYSDEMRKKKIMYGDRFADRFADLFSLILRSTAPLLRFAFGAGADARHLALGLTLGIWRWG